MVVDYKDMVEILEDNKDLFSVEEMANLLAYTPNGFIRRCSECGKFISAGYIMDNDEDYCSAECLKRGKDLGDFILRAYCLQDSPIAKLKGIISPELLEEICEYTEGGRGLDEYYAEELIPQDLADRLNKALARWE